jgi:hypothetical protein
LDAVVIDDSNFMGSFPLCRECLGPLVKLVRVLDLGTRHAVNPTSLGDGVNSPPCHDRAVMCHGISAIPGGGRSCHSARIPQPTMNHPAPVHDFLSPEVQAVIRQRVGLAARCLESLFSKVCVATLLLIPVLFAVAHHAAEGEPWNFATGEKFNPMFHVISAYAWRSPAGWAMVACMACFAGVLGYISWHAAKCGPGFFHWLTAVTAAIAMALVLQAAWVPFKPDAETFHEIQQESAYGPTRRMKQEMWSGGLYAMGVSRPEWVRSPEYLSSLRSHWIHQYALGSAQVLLMVCIISASFIWKSGRPDRRFWRSFRFWAEWVVVLVVAAGISGRVLLPEYSGLTQRVTYLGFYLWLLFIVREIEKHRSLIPDMQGINERKRIGDCLSNEAPAV